MKEELFEVLLHMLLYAQHYVCPVDLTEIEEELKFIAEKLKISKAEAIREAIRYYAEELRGLEILELRDIPKEQARKEILDYIKGKTG